MPARKVHCQFYFFEGPLEEFWKKVPSLDTDFESRRQKLEDENKGELVGNYVKLNKEYSNGYYCT